MRRGAASLASSLVAAVRACRSIRRPRGPRTATSRRSGAGCSGSRAGEDVAHARPGARLRRGLVVVRADAVRHAGRLRRRDAPSSRSWRSRGRRARTARRFDVPPPPRRALRARGARSTPADVSTPSSGSLAPATALAGRRVLPRSRRRRRRSPPGRRRRRRARDAGSRLVVAFRLTGPDPLFLHKLAMPFAAVVDREAVEREGQQGFARRPAGTGPFVVDEWVYGQRAPARAQPALLPRGPAVSRRRRADHRRQRPARVVQVPARRARRDRHPVGRVQCA